MPPATSSRSRHWCGDANVLLGDDLDEKLGSEIGPYRILQRLGVGGMGEVYLAQDARLDRLVALKILPAYFASDDTRLRRFQREARAASSLNHPNILTIHEVGETDGVYFIATEFIDGETIRQLAAERQLSFEEILIWRSRSRRRSPRRTPQGSFTATSSRKTSCDAAMAW